MIRSPGRRPFNNKTRTCPPRPCSRERTRVGSSCVEKGTAGRRTQGGEGGRVGIAVRPRVYVPARELISREPLCSLTDQTTTGHYAPSTHVGNTYVHLGRSRGRIKANLHDILFDDHRVDVSSSGKTDDSYAKRIFTEEIYEEQLKSLVSFLLSCASCHDFIINS